ncbi:MAG: twin-arginine translocase TatA/TatE family subunit [Anaerolineae bacterium]|nr:twin-arginine translocase TatA/TatE family subunit [Anaerolineae bacterium]
MLDNLGMGEFLILALFALLFFGPERLPEMGARVGRWLSQLTQASKVFMTQWTEEAAAIQDAVREIEGIRDEIRAAQAEISGSLDVARQDIAQTIDEARSTVREATITPERFLAAGDAKNAAAASGARALDTSAPPRLATEQETEQVTRVAPPSGGSEGKALSKTQSVLDDLLAKRGLSPAAADQPGDDGIEPAPAAPDASSGAPDGDAQDDEYERNLRAIQEIMERDARRAAEKAQKSQVGTDQAAAAPAPSAPEPADRAEEAEAEAKPVRESPYEKTQRILDGLLSKGAPEPPAEAQPVVVEPPVARALAETASEVEVAPAAASVAEATPDALPGSTGAAQTTPDASPASTAAARPAGPPRDSGRSGEIQRVTGLQQGIGYGEFTKLSIEVTELGRELRALQKELQALRSQAFAPDRHVSDRSGPAAAAEDDSKARPVEEAA